MLMKTTDVARELNVCVRTVRTLVDDGKLQFIDLGRGKNRVLRFRREDIERLLAQ